MKDKKTTSQVNDARKSLTTQDRARRKQQLFFGVLAVIIILSMLVTAVKF